MADSEEAVAEKNEDAVTRDHSFLECLAQSEALVDKAPLKNTGDLGVRMMHLSTGNVIFVMLVVETPDSFVVSHPASLLKTDGVVSAELMMGLTNARLLKSSIISVSVPSETHKYHYLRFLIEDLNEVPTLLDGKRLENALQFVSQHREKVQAASQTELSEDDDEDDDEVASINYAPYNNKTRH